MSEIQSTVTGPTGYGNGYEPVGGAALMLAASSYKNGSYDSPLAVICTEAVCDLRREVQSVTSEIRDTIQDTSLQLNNRMCEAEKAGIRAELESKAAIKDAVCTINDRISDTERRLDERADHFERHVNDKFDRTNDRLDHVEENVLAKVDAVKSEVVYTRETLHRDIDATRLDLTNRIVSFEKNVDEKFCAIERRELERENKALQFQVSSLKEKSQTAEIIAALNAKCCESKGNGNN